MLQNPIHPLVTTFTFCDWGGKHIYRLLGLGDVQIFRKFGEGPTNCGLGFKGCIIYKTIVVAIQKMNYGDMNAPKVSILEKCCQNFSRR